MFRTRLSVLALSGALMLVSGCLQFGSGQGLFVRRPLFSEPCCDTCSSCSGSPTVISQGPPTVISDMPTYQVSPGSTMPPPRIITNQNSPMVPYPGP